MADGTYSSQIRFTSLPRVLSSLGDGDKVRGTPAPHVPMNLGDSFTESVWAGILSLPPAQSLAAGFASQMSTELDRHLTDSGSPW